MFNYSTIWDNKQITNSKRNTNEHLSYQMTNDLLQNNYFLTVISNYHEIYKFKLNFKVTWLQYMVSIFVCLSLLDIILILYNWFVGEFLVHYRSYTECLFT